MHIMHMNSILYPRLPNIASRKGVQQDVMLKGGKVELQFMGNNLDLDLGVLLSNQGSFNIQLEVVTRKLN